MQESKFYSKTIPEPNTGCWIWIGATTGSVAAYGHLTIKNKSWKAHRYAWTLANGEIPAGLSVCHKCDVPLCVNPAHLFLGSHSDNMRDMHKKQRHQMRDKAWVANIKVTGELNPKAKLSWGDVRNIRQSTEEHVWLAALYGVSKSTISSIKTNRTWKE